MALNTVRHITHVPVARRILEDGKINAGLVYDKSRLNETRLSVAWVSANEWEQGSIYGTVEFQFDWKKLVEGQRIYWVEAMDAYKPPAYRFLLSKEPIESKLVTPYDPKSAKGPLKYVGDGWTWSGWNLTSEFMIAEDLPLNIVSGLNFVPHHEKYCQPYDNLCDDMKNKPPVARTGAKLLAYVIGHDLHNIDAFLRPREPENRNQLFEGAYADLSQTLGASKFGGALDLNQSCDKVARGALALYGMDQTERSKDLLSVIMKRGYFEAALRRVVRTHFNTPNWAPKT